MSAALMVSFDESLLAKLDAIAEMRQVSREALLREAVASFLEQEEAQLTAPLEPWQREQIEAGLEAARQGDFATDEEMQRIISKYDQSG